MSCASFLSPFADMVFMQAMAIGELNMWLSEMGSDVRYELTPGFIDSDFDGDIYKIRKISSWKEV